MKHERADSFEIQKKSLSVDFKMKGERRGMTAHGIAFSQYHVHPSKVGAPRPCNSLLEDRKGLLSLLSYKCLTTTPLNLLHQSFSPSLCWWSTWTDRTYSRHFNEKRLAICSSVVVVELLLGILVQHLEAFISKRLNRHERNLFLRQKQQNSSRGPHPSQHYPLDNICSSLKLNVQGLKSVRKE